jgi:hypothetical protein
MGPCEVEDLAKPSGTRVCQATIETSTFGSEFVAAKVTTETIRGVQYKLRMLGVPIDGPTFFFGDNMSVITNTSIPESVLKKKSNSITYCCVREAVAMGEILPAYVDTMLNTSDILTKVLPNGELRDKIVRVDPLGHLIESWLSEHLSFKESEVIRVPGVGTIYRHEYCLIIF